MATQAQTTQHLDAARQLLDDVMEEAAAAPRPKATAAVAHATLVLAEQVAAVRLVMAADAAGNGAAPAAPPEGAPAVEAVPRPRRRCAAAGGNASPLRSAAAAPRARARRAA